jgi:hypothetical protein
MSSSFSSAATMNRGKIDAAGDVALEDGVAHMPAPHGQALALALLEVAAAHNRPPCVAGEHPPARLDLVVEVGETSEARKWAGDVHEHFDLPQVQSPRPISQSEATTARRSGRI